jgi:hypothetical protein
VFGLVWAQDADVVAGGHADALRKVIQWVPERLPER